MLLFLASLLFVQSTKVDAAVGIDLGTTFCCVGIFKKGDTKPSFLQFNNGQYIYPSVAYYNEIGGKGVYMTGWEAYSHNLSNAVPGRYFYGFKRAMGVTDVNEISQDTDFQKSVTYRVKKERVEGKDKIIFIIEDENQNLISKTDPESLSAEVLKDLKNEIEKYYNIVSLVITVPAYFSTFQGEITKKAAALAGLPEPNIKKEPTAAAYAYQVLKNVKVKTKSEKVFVFDLGGGTFDVSVLDCMTGFADVEEYDGNNFLGGENVNDNLTNYFCKIIEKEKQINVKNDKTLNLRLRRFVEEFKIKLCNNYTKDKSQNIYEESFIYEGMNEIKLSLSIEKFDELNVDFYDRIRGVVDRTLRSIGDKAKQISKVLLVGGSTRIPYIKTLLNETFPKAQIYDDLDADTIVAEGACLQAAYEMDILPEDMSVLLLDRAALSIGVCVGNNEFSEVYKKGDVVPGFAEQVFTTSHDGQTKVRIRIAQGVRAAFSDNVYLGECELDVSPNQPRGVPRIKVKIHMSADGTIEVTASDDVSKKETDVKFDSTVARLDAKKYQQLLEEAETNKAADQEIKNRFNRLRDFEAEIALAKSKISMPGVSEDDKINVEGLVNGATKWVTDNSSSASASDIEDRHNSFKQAVSDILDKKGENTNNEKIQDEKTSGRDEL